MILKAMIYYLLSLISDELQSFHYLLKTTNLYKQIPQISSLAKWAHQVRDDFCRDGKKVRDSNVLANWYVLIEWILSFKMTPKPLS